MKDVVKRIIFFFATVLIFAWAGQAGEGCWRWEKKTLTGDPPDTLERPQAAFDKNAQKIALFPYYHYPLLPTLLLHYDGSQWAIAWEGGAMDMAGQPAGFVEADAMYFDDKLGTLMLMGWIAYGFEDGGTGIFEYIPGHGFRYKADFHVALRDSWACYDSNRGVAMFGGAIGLTESGMTVEYDGKDFKYVLDPDGYTLSGGKAAFNPETGHVVYFGPNRKGQGLETLEWDGTSWMIIPTPRKPSETAAYMVYVPDFQGIVALVNICEVTGCSPVQTWLYRNQTWLLLDFRDSPTAWRSKAPDSFIAYDKYRHIAILSGIPHSFIIESTWELAPARHCKPLGKPE